MIHLLIADAKKSLQFAEKWAWDIIKEPHAEKQSVIEVCLSRGQKEKRQKDARMVRGGMTRGGRSHDLILKQKPVVWTRRQREDMEKLRFNRP